MPPETHDVAISVVNTSNRDLLHSCLTSLPQACQGLRWHATVVDNASEDGSAEMVEKAFPWARVLRNVNRAGFSANHNRVIREVLDSASARYVLILNEDTELDRGSVQELVRFSDANGEVGATVPVIRGTDGQLQPSCFSAPTVLSQFWYALRPRTVPAPPPRGEGVLNGSCLLVRAQALREIGLLDEQFFIFFEDVDLGIRLRAAGWASAACEAATIVHHGHQTVSQPGVGGAMEQQMMRSRYLYFRKHLGPVRAGIGSVLIRAALLLRAAKPMACGLFRPAAGAQANLLLDLARYDPAFPLPHESDTQRVPR